MFYSHIILLGTLDDEVKKIGCDVMQLFLSWKNRADFIPVLFGYSKQSWSNGLVHAAEEISPIKAGCFSRVTFINVMNTKDHNTTNSEDKRPSWSMRLSPTEFRNTS